MNVLMTYLPAKYERYVAIGLLVVAIFLMIFTLKNDFSFWKMAHQPIVTIEISKPQIFVSEEQIALIPTWHLLGIAPAALPGTQLQVQLTGIMMSNPEKYSEAIISISNEPSRVYHEGDTLKGMSVTVHSITQDSVILDNGGRLEKLSLERPLLEFHGLPKASGG